MTSLPTLPDGTINWDQFFADIKSGVIWINNPDFSRGDLWKAVAAHYRALGRREGSGEAKRVCLSKRPSCLLEDILKLAEGEGK